MIEESGFEKFKLNKQLNNALNELGITTPTPIQEKSLPTILAGKDVVGIAQTGTGKTFAFLLPIIRNMKYSDQRQPRAMILVPTRELVVQVVEQIDLLTEFISLRSLGVYGGTNINTQKQNIHDGCDILVATPGRLFDLVMTGVLRLKDVKTLVIDEVDEMLDLGFRPQIVSLLELIPEKRQNLLFSATITPEVEKLINDYFRNPIKIEAAPSGTPLEKINQQVYNAENFNTKVNLLMHLVEDAEKFSKVLVFMSSKKLADKLEERLEEVYPEQIGALHSNKSQNYRLRKVQEFKDGTVRILVATDLVSRGVDIQDVTHVINFDLPDYPENYIHRIGRTGRAEQKGEAISFVSEEDKVFQQHIEGLMKQSIPVLDFPEEVEITDELIEEELPEEKFTGASIKVKRRTDIGPAFHEKKQKNAKVNLGNSKKNKKEAKYKKPLKRGQKKNRFNSK